MEKLRTIWLVLHSKAFLILADNGVASRLPLDVDVLQDLQDEAERFDNFVEELRNELILEDRSSQD